jgi:hypothetical protein
MTRCAELAGKSQAPALSTVRPENYRTLRGDHLTGEVVLICEHYRA